MNCELLQEAVCALQNFLNSGFPDEWDDAVRQVNQDLIDRLEVEADKPEPIECGSLDVRPDVFLNSWKLDGIESGKYRLFAEKIV
jgi:hypothetical protein